MNYKTSLLFFTFLFCFNFLFAQGEERIIDFDVVLQVNDDCSIDVKEYIKVYANGTKIKRGITRNLPSKRQMTHRSLKMKYDIIEIRKNDVEEPYFTEDYKNGFMIYIGQRDVLLSAGVYTYMIHYKVPNQIGFFNDYDEIYWNAIGTDVSFKIENASCKVRLPAGANIIQEAAYIGRSGEVGQEYELKKNGSLLDYRIEKSLEPYEGFAIAVGFEKGILEEPGFLTRYGTLLVVLLGAFLLIPYYVYTWWKYGRDPESPSVGMVYEVPNNLSPASVNYIETKGWALGKSFTAAILSLATKGYLKIEEYEKVGVFSDSSGYRLHSLKPSDSSLFVEEQIILSSLFHNSDTIDINGKYNSKLKPIFDHFKENLSNQHDAFLKEGNNLKFVALPTFISMVIIGFGFLAYFSSPYAYSLNVVLLMVFVVFALISIFTYMYLIQQPTIEKLKLKAQLSGFKQYLGLVKDFESEAPDAPKPDIDYFEALLPYAFALGEEEKWSKRFEKLLQKADYRPDWNDSVNGYLFYSTFGNNFSTQYSSTVTPPSDSGSGFSGSGGGGFSGGGGGGGGVGGW